MKLDAHGTRGRLQSPDNAVIRSIEIDSRGLSSELGVASPTGATIYRCGNFGSLQP